MIRKTLREGFKTSLSLGTGGILGLAGTAVQNLVEEKKSSVDINLGVLDPIKYLELWQELVFF